MEATMIMLLAIVLFTVLGVVPKAVAEEDTNPVPARHDVAGKNGAIAAESVFQIVVPKQNCSGTGFLHTSGNVLTAAHVIKGADPKDVMMLLGNGNKVHLKKIVADYDVDIALLVPRSKINATALPLSTAKTFQIGSQVSTWGFPAGYRGPLPMLSVGYLSGKDVTISPSGKRVERWVVNAAFNGGNSGGPLIDISSGAVIGIVASKLAPMPPDIEGALDALRNDTTISSFKVKAPDGTTRRISNSQVLEKVLQYLRSQTQLVVGRAVLLGDVESFLKKCEELDDSLPTDSGFLPSQE